ncbi:MAG: DUF2752 domain-containing protein [Solirubrobacterales bacterium]
MSFGRSSARPSTAAAGVLLASAALSAASEEPGVGRYLAVRHHRVPDLCPIHRATGRNCPGCGMGRAFTLLWRCRVRQAVRSNPASPFLFAALVCIALAPIGRLGRTAAISKSVPSINPEE